MRKALICTSAVAAVAVALVAQPAQADSALVTLPVGLANPTLSIAAPLAVVTPGDPATATIASVVSDLRLSGTGWTVTIAAEDLKMAGVTDPSNDQKIPASTMTAYTGDVESTVPGLVTIAGEFTASTPLPLANTSKDLLTATSRTNVNTAAFTTTVKIPTTGKTQGIYTGIVTQSVS
ncbi:MAG: hypothetical protein JWM62_971 [Frankiales bacterium]|jgi:hypothetical protein|nr:hypothetical protein [Frankiales bacterium]